MIKLEISEYRAAENELMSKVMSGMIALDPLLGSIPVLPSAHGGPTRNVRDPRVLDQDGILISHQISIHHDIIRNTLIDEFLTELIKLAQAFRDSQAKDFFASMEEITDATGNTIDANGQHLSMDLIIDSLERLPIEFDEEGNALLPSIIVHPHMAEHLRNLVTTPEQDARFRTMIDKKKVEFYAAQRTRRLS